MIRVAFLPFLLSLAVAAPAFSLTEVLEPENTVRPRRLILVEGQPGSLPIVSSAASAENFSVAVGPRNGSAVIHGEVLVYEPRERNFVGRDTLTVVATDAVGQFVESMAVEVRILPSLIPFAGRFLGNAHQGPGLYDVVGRIITLCSDVVGLDQHLTCQRFPVDGLESGHYVPIAWPGRDENSSDLLALVNLEGGKVSILAPTASGRLQVVRGFDLPGGGRGAWPIFGDWGGTETRQLAVVLESGQVIGMDQDGVMAPWHVEFEAPENDALVWPILLLEKVNGHDAIALASSRSGDLWWLAIDSWAASEEPSFSSSLDFSRPLTWDMTPNPAHFGRNREVFFFETHPPQLRPGKYKASRPATIAVRFPDDPPVGPGFE